MKDIFHLFPPIEVERAKQLRSQALKVTLSILDELLCSLPLEDKTLSGDDLIPQDSGYIPSEVDAKDSFAEQEMEPHEEGVVSDEERAADRKIRHHIYLCVLNLACAMVSHQQFSSSHNLLSFS